MSDLITLTGVRAWGRHGVLAGEQATGQAFVVDVALRLDTRPAAEGDDLAATVHYGELAEAVVGIVEGEPVQLIETLAARIATHCLTLAPVTDVEVTVHKPHAPIAVPFTDVAVTIARSRQAVSTQP